VAGTGAVSAALTALARKRVAATNLTLARKIAFIM
jgi:hypothetical protein